ncbi:MAG TPA: Crp/Fnr family transcriptional regulator [Chitinophagales bacterium]|jgi:CRP/FNR family transcriptional regulator|nr:Crp/Fnr family transcriptional regulator [Chitinophagales bacterium]HPH88764.1 Crp/Fnr family transcriptional regulator [Chitinophagales bacterium]HPN18642.1 Crp/Fnr family transcriptional regulator [Chitinophagales bacterium]
MQQQEIQRIFPFLSSDVLEDLLTASAIKEFPKQTELIREGQFIKVIPIVLKGLIKVFTRKEDKELLLYYIQPGESCIMSFSAALKNDTSKIVAITEEETELILLPTDKIAHWLVAYPSINMLFYQQYEMRYTELIDTINQLLYDKLDKRIMTYLQEKSELTGKNPIKITHKEIALELGTAREVVSRILKKLEKLEKVKQHQDSIEIIH